MDLVNIICNLSSFFISVFRVYNYDCGYFFIFFSEILLTSSAKLEYFEEGSVSVLSSKRFCNVMGLDQSVQPVWRSAYAL